MRIIRRRVAAQTVTVGRTQITPLVALRGISIGGRGGGLRAVTGRPYAVQVRDDAGTISIRKIPNPLRVLRAAAGPALVAALIVSRRRYER